MNLFWLNYTLLSPFQLWFLNLSWLIYLYDFISISVMASFIIYADPYMYSLSFSVQLCLFPIYADSYMYLFITSVLLYIFSSVLIHIWLRYSFYCWLARIAICSDPYVHGSFITTTVLFPYTLNHISVYSCSHHFYGFILYIH